MAHTLMVGGIELLELLFAAGILGSLVLVVLTAIDDFREVFHRPSDEQPELLTGD